jgi:hypothetical protein
MKLHNTSFPKHLTGGAIILAVTASLFAQEKPYTQPGTGQHAAPLPAPKPAAAPAPADTKATPPPEPDPFEKFFNVKIPEAISKGKFNLNARLRLEFVDQNGVATITEPSYAPTIRTRFGYTTAPLYGFQAMLEGENVTAIGSEDNYNAAGSNGTGYKPVVADPPTTELNQAWLAYSYTNWITAKFGRQRIVLDNHRFIGDVGWRQNMQTFDAVSAESKPFDGLGLYYAYIWDTHRVFGDVPKLPAANHDFKSRSHLFNVSYTPCQYGRFVGYTYLLDLQNAAGAAQSSATYGGYFAGSAPVADKASLAYRAEVGFQTDYADSLQEYQAEYYNFELSGTVDRFSVGGGYEVLGTDSNDNGAGGVGFRTPLATLHAFNGWADVFLGTPGRGLRDAYGFAQVILPLKIPLRAVYHKFDADSGGADFGQEFDLQISKKFGKHWSALAKYGYYDGKDPIGAAATTQYDLHKFWAQIEFNF